MKSYNRDDRTDIYKNMTKGVHVKQSKVLLTYTQRTP